MSGVIFRSAILLLEVAALVTELVSGFGFVTVLLLWVTVLLLWIAMGLREAGR